MTESNTQQTTNSFLKISDAEIIRVDFHKSKGNMASFDTEIKKIVVFDTSTYSKNKGTGAKYYIWYENYNKIKTLLRFHK